MPVKEKIGGFLRLMRPANIVTAVTDILAGVAIAGYAAQSNLFQQSPSSIVLLAFSTIGLYGGGVVFNDVFDAELDAVERPERPIPSGLISRKSATVLALFLLIIGIVAAVFAHPNTFFSTSFLLACAIAIVSIVYDKWVKHHNLLGPFNMGLCRGLNLLLGMSIISGALQQYWPLMFVPIIYIAAITAISRGEVHGGNQHTLKLAFAFYAIVIGSIGTIAFFNNTLLYAIPFLVLFAVLIFSPLLKAAQKPEGLRIGKAVKAGVLALIVMNASWAAAFGAVTLAVGVLLLLPLSLLLAKAFAVT